jgi:spore germination cell wall hydrolase CwlJ-like protein
MALGLAVTVSGALGFSTQAAAGQDVERELHCLALNIYFEARGESETGKIAVGHVVMNRVMDAKYPDSVCDVVMQGGERRRHKCQFSWWCDGRSDTPRNKRAWWQSKQLAFQIYVGMSQDPTDGALWYHADYVKPIWRKALKRGPKIGQHIFYLALDTAKGRTGDEARESHESRGLNGNGDGITQVASGEVLRVGAPEL